MDLNEKIAARRRELAREAEKIKTQEDERTAAAVQQADLLAAQQKRREKEALESAVKRRLSEQGIDEILNPEPPKEQIDAATEALLNKAATNRMSSGENAIFFALVAFAVFSIAVAWWLVVIFIILVAIFMNKMTEKYKKEILGEGDKFRATVKQKYGLSPEPAHDSSQCIVCLAPIQPADTRCGKCFAQLR